MQYVSLYLPHLDREDFLKSSRHESSVVSLYGPEVTFPAPSRSVTLLYTPYHPLKQFFIVAKHQAVITPPSLPYVLAKLSHFFGHSTCQ